VNPVAKPERGFVLGKFMPPHQGHVFLCDFARAYCRRLTILVCSLDDDPIPGALRHAWMTELFPDCEVRWCAEPLPQEPADDPRFWEIWADVVARYGGEPDVVFASEAYGERLAAEVGATFVPVDHRRLARPASGTAVRADPFARWEDIPAPVRPWFVKRVCVFGPESTGKTTLAGRLAGRFHTACAPEYGRTYTEAFGTEVGPDDLLRIALGQVATRTAVARQANRILIEDTDPVLTAVWSDMLTGDRHPWFAAFDDHAHLYLLCDTDAPWVDDGTRYFPKDADRRRFSDLCEAELVARGVAYVVLRGGWEEREAQATAAILAAFPSLAGVPD
jgi:HTH-type transcriptional regulator, transcriptional repressor of NAD biosynthesis genes